MRIGVIQASSQKDKNPVLEKGIRESVPKEYEVVNFGVFPEEDVQISYVQIALCVAMLLQTGAVDFIVTGCSSGQGMMLACNSFPGVVCGYVQDATDAYLFGRINDGNAIAYPLGYHWGWAAEIGFKDTIRALFCEPLGNGYPAEEAERKRRDTAKLKEINALCKKTFPEVLGLLDRELVRTALSFGTVYDDICEHGTDQALIALLKEYRNENGQNDR